MLGIRSGNWSGWKAAFLEKKYIMYINVMNIWWAAAQRQARMEGEDSDVLSRCSNMTLNCISSGHTSHTEGRQLSISSNAGTCGLEQKKLCYFLSLAKYFWAAIAFALLTGVKPYLVANPLPAPMDNWLLSTNLACSIFYWDVAQLLQNRTPNFLIIQQYWGYMAKLTHTLSHVSAASVPFFCFPEEHMHAFTCVYKPHTLWSSKASCS